MPAKQGPEAATAFDDEETRFWRPDDVPPDLTQVECSIIAARNVRAWADWLLQEGPAPERGDKLVDIGERGGL